MTVQTFRGKTTREAHERAVAALGKELVIMTTRNVPRAGLSGFLGGCDVELTAASKETTPAPETTKRPFADRVYLAKDEKPAAASSDAISLLRAEIRTDLRALKAAMNRPDATNELVDELAAMRRVFDLMTSSEEGGKKSPYAAHIRRVGIEGIAAQELMKALKNKESRDEREAFEIFRHAVADMIPLAASPLAAPGKKVISLVGPSGVGKTTTAAKIAARAIEDLGMSVLLVACDTFRVGAVEQLRRYAELMGAGFAMADTAQDLAKIVRESTADFVIVDTSGQPEAKKNGPEAFLREDAAIGRERVVLLCLSAQTRMVDATKLARQFRRVRPTALVITKLDETAAPAALVHGPAAANIPISVMCFGPRVPEDIGAATSGAALEYLAPNRSNGAKKAA